MVTVYIQIVLNLEDIYRGTNSNNYITFNNEDWGILSIESDGTIKIVKTTSIGNINWDSGTTRSSSTSTYCSKASSSGCNAWAATSNLVGTPSEFKLYYPYGNMSRYSSYYSGTVTVNSSLNTYLNQTTSGGYYYSLGADKQYIVSHDFYVGTPGDSSDEESIATDVEQEKQYTWNGKVGLITVTEYLKTSTNSSCTSLSAAYNSNCGTNNWLKPSSGVAYWTISPSVTYECSNVWYVNSDKIRKLEAWSLNGVRPTVYLSSNIKLSGSGTTGSKYTITGTN